MFIKRGYKIFVGNRLFVAHHPDIEFPYSKTKPLPERKLEETMFKENSKNMFTKSPNLEQLQALTYTPASYWKSYPGKEKRAAYKACQDDNVDRTGLSS